MVLREKSYSNTVFESYKEWSALFTTYAWQHFDPELVVFRS
jgi:hypothetical protein